MVNSESSQAAAGKAGKQTVAEKVQNVLVVDSQGGGMGRQLVAAIKTSFPQLRVHGVGTNATATTAMLKAGADSGATGENPVRVACRDADIIVGPVGIVIADAMMGEVTPAMAVAIGQSRAKRILIPVNHCDNIVVGIPELSMGKLVEQAMEQIRQLLG